MSGRTPLLVKSGLGIRKIDSHSSFSASLGLAKGTCSCFPLPRIFPQLPVTWELGYKPTTLRCRRVVVLPVLYGTSGLLARLTPQRELLSSTSEELQVVVTVGWPVSKKKKKKKGKKDIGPAS